MTQLKFIGLSALTVFSVFAALTALYLLTDTDPLPSAKGPSKTPTKSTSEAVCDKKHSAYVFGFEFCYPKNWFFAEFGDDKETVAIDPNGQPSDGPSALVAVSAIPETSAEVLARLRESFSQEKESRLTLDGVDSTSIVGQLDGEKQQSIVATRGRYTYVVTMRAVSSTFDRYYPTFENLLTTWRWINITAHAPVRSIAGDLVVELPFYGSLIKSPATLKGKVRSFESHFAWRLKDADGKVIASGFGNASGGNAGQLNSFSTLIKFTVPERETGTLEVYTESVKDGFEENMVVIPVKLR